MPLSLSAHSEAPFIFHSLTVQKRQSEQDADICCISSLSPKVSLYSCSMDQKNRYWLLYRSPLQLRGGGGGAKKPGEGGERKKEGGGKERERKKGWKEKKKEREEKEGRKKDRQTSLLDEDKSCEIVLLMVAKQGTEEGWGIADTNLATPHGKPSVQLHSFSAKLHTILWMKEHPVVSHSWFSNTKLY